MDPSKGEPVKIVLVTANTGSIFEDPDRLLPIWLNEFKAKVTELQPQFFALHLQEVGGKTYEKSLEFVQVFIRSLCEAQEMRDFDVIRIFMDEDFNSAEHFTALGNLYFVHKSLKDIRIWNFLTHDWEVAENKRVYSGNIETIPNKEKAKFPQHFFPECKWSRKGFMRTRWEINKTSFDLVNIHLFHDASNLVACEEFPSVYCKTRRRALVHTLERFHLDQKNGVAPYFIFGDFNFRCDTEGVIKELTQNLTAHRVQSLKNDSTKIHYRNNLGNNLLTVGKKEFSHADHQLKFKETWLKKYDRELEVLKDILLEYPITFPPSYPFEEDPDMPSDYMSTRCPSWCDRILMSPTVKDIMAEEDSENPYDVIGERACMGDHKPIYLLFRLKPNQGIYRCCECYLRQDKRKEKPNNDETEELFEYDCKSPVKSASLRRPVSMYRFCPYTIKAYTDILEDCRVLNDTTDSSYNVAGSIAEKIYKSVRNTLGKATLDDFDDADAVLKYPPAINVIDSDNMLVCMCGLMSSALASETALDKAEMLQDETLLARNDFEKVDRSICSECQNIIKKQPVEHRYRLISKRLMISEDIIVNRIDTQHLSTYDLAREKSDPYTPESIESHSPYPELNSTTTTTSCDSRSPTEKAGAEQLFTGHTADSAQSVGDDVEHTKEELVANTIPHQNETQQQRGIVSPGQLKSRLEDLQRKAIFSNETDFSPTPPSLNNPVKTYKSKNKSTAGLSDPEASIDDCFNMPPTFDNSQNNDDNHDDDNNNIDDNNKNTIKLPAVSTDLQLIIDEVLKPDSDCSDESIWREQSHLEDETKGIKTRYVQIAAAKSLQKDSIDDCKVANDDCADSPNLQGESFPDILKETTV